MRLTPAREALLAGVLVTVVHALVRLHVAPGAFQDDAIYLGLGKALAEGSGWRSLYAVGAPVHLKYPPGLPALYALAWSAGGSLDATLRLVGLLHLGTAGLIGGLAWWIARVRLGLTSARAALALTPLGLVSVIDHLQLPIAEGPFIAVWLAAIAVALGPLDLRRGAGLGLLLALAVLLRAQGWAVLVGILAALALARLPRRVLVVTAVAAVVPLIAWAAAHRVLAAAGPVSTQLDETGYLQWLGTIPVAQLPGTLIRAAWANLAAYGAIIPRELGPAGPGHVVFAAALTLAALGARTGGRRLLPLSLSIALSAALIVVWPFTQARFVLALLPAVALLAAAGVPASIPRTARTGTVALISIVLVAVAARQLTIRAAAQSPDAVAAVGFQPIGRTLTANTAWLASIAPWVQAHTEPDAHVFTEGAAGLWLLSGRPGVAALPATPNVTVPGGAFDPVQYLRLRLTADGIDWVIASSPPVLSAVAAAEQLCGGTFQRGVSIGQAAVAFAVHDSTAACLLAGER